jgi:hypothetical protein
MKQVLQLFTVLNIGNVKFGLSDLQWIFGRRYTKLHVFEEHMCSIFKKCIRFGIKYLNGLMGNVNVKALAAHV